MIKLARSAGFNNVHDYLVYRATGETAEEIADRKSSFSWGAWMDVVFTAEEKIDEEEEEEEKARTPSVEKEIPATTKRGRKELSESGSEDEEVEEPVGRGVRKGTKVVRRGVLAAAAKQPSKQQRVTRNAGLATRGAIAV
jgi:hypothetical protein